jgi:2,4-dienoyl-CoA reductase-like NADH-dependent reductase (Old Yellow Enzyme family)
MAIICSAISYLGVAAPHVVAGYLSENKFDFGGFGRTIFAYPDFAKEILAKGEMDPRKICIACSKCTELMRSPGGTPGCAVRDAIYTKMYQKMKASQGKA